MVLRGLEFNRSDFFAELIEHSRTEDFQYVLSVASRLGPDDTIATLGNTLAAHQSIGTAIACFANSPHSYSDCVARALGLGGDTDTIAAMAGAISGAHLGASAIPQNLLDLLENGIQGRDYIDELAQALFRRHDANRFEK